MMYFFFFVFGVNSRYIRTPCIIYKFPFNHRRRDSATAEDVLWLQNFLRFGSQRQYQVDFSRAA